MASEISNKNIESIWKNQVPGIWHRNSYPTTSSLTYFLKNLFRRLDFLKKWIDRKRPDFKIWLGGFFNPRPFFEAVKLDYAKILDKKIDRVDLEYQVLGNIENGGHDKKLYHLTELFMEGAKWDDKECILTSQPIGCDFLPFPDILVNPKVRNFNVNFEDEFLYKCPIFHTQTRL